MRLLLSPARLMLSAEGVKDVVEGVLLGGCVVACEDEEVEVEVEVEEVAPEEEEVVVPEDPTALETFAACL